MEASVIEHGNFLPPRPPRKLLAADLLARVPQLGNQDNIFYEEHDKLRQQRMYVTLYRLKKRHGLPIEIRFYDDGLRVWRVSD